MTAALVPWGPAALPSRRLRTLLAMGATFLAGPLAGASATLRPRVTVPPATVPVLTATLQYRGLATRQAPVDPLLTVTAFQAIPVAAALRIASRRVRRSREPVAGWRKVAR